MGTSTSFRPTKAIVKLSAIQENIKSLKKYLNTGTLAIVVVKADGYGHGGVQVANAALEAGADMLSVATPDEAVQLRDNGVEGDILVMGHSPIAFAKEAARLDIMIAVPNAEWLQAALVHEREFIKPLKIHIKVDSGMGRMGLRDAEALKALEETSRSTTQLIIDGIFTHFACADVEDPTSATEQFEMFIGLVNLLNEKPRLIHAANSAATLLYPSYAVDAVRFGISLYGIPPSEFVGTRLPFELERSLALETEIVQVKLLEENKSVSYGSTYKTSGNEWIGTIPIGYADGLRRGLRGQEVLIGGERMPIVGSICMDQCMVRLTKEFTIGEKVVLIGQQDNEEIKIEEWAERLGTIPYEIVVSIAERVPRVYI